MANQYNFDESTVEEYLSGSTLRQLGEKYGCDKGTVRRFLIKQGVVLRNSNNVSPYSFNEEWLDCLDSEEKNYFLGMFFADGCNEGNSNRIMISLQESDKSLLEKFIQLWQSNRPLIFVPAKERNRNNNWSFFLTSKKISERLTELGATPQKSLTLTFPQYLEDKFIKDFIRGYFDGDGCISFRTTKTVRISFAGTFYFLTSFQLILKNKLNIESILYKQSNIWILSFCKKEYTYKFLNWIYEDASIYLDRKYEKYKLFLQQNDNFVIN